VVRSDCLYQRKVKDGTRCNKRKVLAGTHSRLITAECLGIGVIFGIQHDIHGVGFMVDGRDTPSHICMGKS